MGSRVRGARRAVATVGRRSRDACDEGGAHGAAAAEPTAQVPSHEQRAPYHARQAQEVGLDAHRLQARARYHGQLRQHSGQPREPPGRSRGGRWSGRGRVVHRRRRPREAGARAAEPAKQGTPRHPGRADRHAQPCPHALLHRGVRLPHRHGRRPGRGGHAGAKRPPEERTTGLHHLGPLGLCCRRGGDPRAEHWPGHVRCARGLDGLEPSPAHVQRPARKGARVRAGSPQAQPGHIAPGRGPSSEHAAGLLPGHDRAPDAHRP
mmetsp:Transcript_37454/g.101478  ORF Transcript_37454/g.101478 Transcript_37454/m.101478 type:complete len:264 (-) Transcript_37454:1096-1887(-)